MASNDSRRFAELLRSIAAAIEKTNGVDLTEVVHELAHRHQAQNSASSEDRLSKSSMGPSKVLQIVSALQESRSREDALSFLRRLKLTRKELTEVARHRSVHIAKEDNLIRIEEKLVEATVGGRLASQAIRGSSAADEPRFGDVNTRILKSTQDRILSDISKQRFKFVFNPETGRSKILTFKSNGEIGEGRNENENAWRVANGRLEILDGRGNVYSRFVILPDGRLHHTNDPDTRSIRGQYLEPLKADAV